MIGDLFNRPEDRGAHSPAPRVGLERAQHGFDRIEVNRRPDRVQSRAELVENWIEFARADARSARRSILRLISTNIDWKAWASESLRPAARAWRQYRVAAFRWGRCRSLRGAPRGTVGRLRCPGPGPRGPGSIATGAFGRAISWSSRVAVCSRRRSIETRPREGRSVRSVDRLPRAESHLGGLGVGSGACAEPLDAVTQSADLALQPLERRCSQRR